MPRVFKCGFKRTQMFCFTIRRVGLKLVESNDGTIWASECGCNQCYIWNNKNKENSLIVTYVAKPRKPLKHNETQLLYVDRC